MLTLTQSDSARLGKFATKDTRTTTHLLHWHAEGGTLTVTQWTGSIERDTETGRAIEASLKKRTKTFTADAPETEPLDVWTAGVFLIKIGKVMHEGEVASLVEAWIEILTTSCATPSGTVASLVEAWIEITRTHPHRGRTHVASLVEAWIEMRSALPGIGPGTRSPPSWRRGLKYDRGRGAREGRVSPPSWRRGLKSRWGPSRP